MAVKRLLIHHHAVAYVDEAGIWLPSFIGRWINALAPHIEQIGLLMYQTDTQTTRQDTLVAAPNVKLYSLGAPGRIWDRIDRMRRLREVCQRASHEADGLLIRGVTPRQYAVWQHTDVPHKAFLLVGSLTENRPVFKLSLDGLYAQWMFRRRPQEIREMAEQGVKLLANSPKLVEEIRNDPGFSAAFVPTNSIQRGEFAELRVRPLNNPCRLLYCGRVTPDKGVSELIEAMALLADCELDIVGACSPPDRTHFESLAERLNVSKRIRWHGVVPYGEELFAFYRHSDLFVLPSYHEGFPHVIWEAAANCCPVITTRVGGIPALWAHGNHGILISAHSSGEIVEAVRSLQADSGLRARLIEAAYEHALNYTVELCAQRLHQTLCEIWG